MLSPAWSDSGSALNRARSDRTAANSVPEPKGGAPRTRIECRASNGTHRRLNPLLEEIKATSANYPVADLQPADELSARYTDLISH